MDLLSRTAAVPTGRDLALRDGFLSMSLLGASSDGASPTIPIVPGETSLEASIRVATSSTGKTSRSVLPAAVTDLSVASTSAYFVMLEWAAVDDETNAPAAYEVRFALAPVGGWHDATVVIAGDCASPPEGSKVGATVSCAAEGLDPATGYHLRLLAFREEKNGKRVCSEDLSNVVATESYAITSGSVEDLSAAGVTDAPVTLKWTKVGDEAGSPALYELRYTASASDHSWDSATVVSVGSCATSMRGSEIGAIRRDNPGEPRGGRRLRKDDQGRPVHVDGPHLRQRGPVSGVRQARRASITSNTTAGLIR